MANVGSDLWNWAVSDPSQWGRDVAGNLGDVGKALVMGPPGDPSVLANALKTNKPPDPAKVKTKSTSSNELTSAIEQALGQPWNQFMVQMGQLGQQLSTANSALNAWASNGMNQAIQAAGGNQAIVSALQNYQAATSAAEPAVNAALQFQGQANQAYLQSSALAPLLNLLTQGFGSAQYKEIPISLYNQLPEQLQYALSQAGVEQAGGGVLPAPKGGWPSSLTQGQSDTANALTGLGTTPSAIASNISQTGNPNTPGS